MNREMVIIIAGGISILGLLIFLYKYKKEYLKVIAYYVVTRVEEEYLQEKGKEKLKLAILKFKERLPVYLSWLISEKFIISLLEEALKVLQGNFKSAKDKQLQVINELIKKVDVDPKVTTILKREIKEKGYVEGYIEARNNFKGDIEAVAGVKAGINL